MKMNDFLNNGANVRLGDMVGDDVDYDFILNSLSTAEMSDDEFEAHVLAKLANNEFNEDEFYDEEEEDAYFASLGAFDDYSGNMPCDNSGFCGGTGCPNFYKCHGTH